MKKKYTSVLAILSIFFVFLNCKNTKQVVDNKVNEINSELTIDWESGLVIDKNLALVKAQCTACHSAKLITMNRFTREGWKDKIFWMQQTQKLWDLGESEKDVLDYLSSYYAPGEKVSRRDNLKNIEWYTLKNE